MSFTTLAALIIDISHPASGRPYGIELKWRPEGPGAELLSPGSAADPSEALQVAERALQAHFRLGVPIEFHGNTYDSVADAMAAIRTYSQEWS